MLNKPDVSSLNNNKQKIADVICCDLDGTLWSGDLMHLSASERPWYALKGIWIWLFKGRVAYKNYLANELKITLDKIEFFPEILAWVQKQKELGAKVVLITGSVQTLADQLITKLPFLDAIYATGTGKINLVGDNKGRFIAEQFKGQTTIYLGNEWKDRLVWKYCTKAGGVNISAKTKTWLQANFKDAIIFECCN